jgi:protoporphyrinogen oxidase
LYRNAGEDQHKEFKVGIIGAGVAGLFTAMIFDHLKDLVGLDVDYQILEANGEERIGGRLYSYYFPKIDNQPDIGPHDYYDVGAMRFPGNKIMARYFHAPLQ